MKPYIDIHAEEIVSRYLLHGISDADKLIDKVTSELYRINSIEDKFRFLQIILVGNESALQEHLIDCTNHNDCDTNKKHYKVNYFLQQELHDLGFDIPKDSFTSDEKNDFNQKLDAIIDALIENDKMVQDQINQLKQEIEELKALYIIGKKNWKQLLLGKTGEMVASGIVSEAVSKPLFDIAKNTFQHLIP